MLRWQPGATLLSAFDIKIGRLSASVRKQTLTVPAMWQMTQ